MQLTDRLRLLLIASGAIPLPDEKQHRFSLVHLHAGIEALVSNQYVTPLVSSGAMILDEHAEVNIDSQAGSLTLKGAPIIISAYQQTLKIYTAAKTRKGHEFAGIPLRHHLVNSKNSEEGNLEMTVDQATIKVHFESPGYLFAFPPYSYDWRESVRNYIQSLWGVIVSKSGIRSRGMEITVGETLNGRLRGEGKSGVYLLNATSTELVLHLELSESFPIAQIREEFARQRLEELAQITYPISETREVPYCKTVIFSLKRENGYLLPELITKLEN